MNPKISETALGIHGYAIAFNKVLRDEKVSIGAKGLYSYLCSYAGTKRIAFPTLNKILKELSLSKSTLYKYTEELTSSGYILTMNLQRAKGRRKSKHYFIRYHLDHTKDYEDMIKILSSLNYRL